MKTETPLQGINVLDLGTGGVGPWATMLLGLLGADVIKVEPPLGDALRHQPPYQQGISTAYMGLNFNKRVFQKDLKDPSNLESIKPLVRDADVIMENLRPSKLDKLGLSFQEVHKINPHIVYVSCPCWGMDGPMRDFQGANPHAEVFGGLASINGVPGKTPELARNQAAVDFTAGNYLLGAILTGLVNRSRTGEGQYIWTSQAGAAICSTISRASEYLVCGNVPLRMGNASPYTAPDQAFLCQDGRYLAVSVLTDAHWRGFCDAIGAEDLARDSRLSTNAGRAEHRERLDADLSERLLTRPTTWWAIRLTRSGVPNGLFLTYNDLRQHSHVLDNQFLRELSLPRDVRLVVSGAPWKFSRTTTIFETKYDPGDTTDKFWAGKSTAREASRAGSVPADGAPPLQGLKVVDMSQGLSGPYLSLLLADVGADVVKVEPPGGDYARSFVPTAPNGAGASFLMLNRNKDIRTIDSQSAEGKGELRELLRDADVLIEEFAPGKNGIEDTGAGNPRLIHCTISSFGETGGLQESPGSELVAQAVGGYWQVFGEVNEPPERKGVDIASVSTSIFAYQGVLAALLERDRSGNGQHVSVSLLSSLLAMQSLTFAGQTNPDDWAGFYCTGPTMGRMHPYRTKDGAVFFGTPLTIGSDITEQYLVLLEAFGAVDEAARIREWAKDQTTVAVYEYLRLDMDLWEGLFRSRSTQEVVQTIIDRGVVAVPLNGVGQALEHPQSAYLGIERTSDVPQVGEVRFLAPPWHGSWEESAVTLSPALVGEA